MAYAELEKLRLYYERAGSGESELLFVPGWSCGGEAFKPQFDYFAQAHTVTAIDPRGFGKSDRPETGYHIRDFADDLADFCKHVGIVKPVVIGHSLGGGIAVELGARYPSLPRALILVDPVSIDMTPETIKSFDGAADQLEGPCGEEVRRLWTESMGALDPELARWITDHMCATPLQVAAAVIRNLTSWNGVGALSNCEVPTLLVGRAGITAEVARLLAIKPDLQVGMTVGSGHFNQLEVPEQVNAMIERFLSVSA